MPIGKLICASNDNKVLYDFLGDGTYDRNREFILTSSPSMDILISSNLERLIYLLTGENPENNANLMNQLSKEGKYSITKEMKALLEDFVGGYASEEETAQMIRSLYEGCGYVIDTHTAVAASVYEKYKKETKDQTKSLITSTASPYKFTKSVMTAIDAKYEGQDELKLVDELSTLSNVAIPKAIEEIMDARVVHDLVVETDSMKEAVIDFLGL